MHSDAFGRVRKFLDFFVKTSLKKIKKQIDRRDAVLDRRDAVLDRRDAVPDRRDAVLDRRKTLFTRFDRSKSVVKETKRTGVRNGVPLNIAPRKQSTACRRDRPQSPAGRE